MSNKIQVIASIATIPPRINNGDLKKCVDSLLKQTHKLSYIFVAIPKNYKRFGQLTNLPDWLQQDPYKSKVICIHN